MCIYVPIHELIVEASWVGIGSVKEARGLSHFIVQMLQTLKFTFPASATRPVYAIRHHHLDA